MDCEKFESTLMDELYGELDELTSAASKRHVASCARCASLLHGLSATRRIAVLEMVEPPPGLEQRILAATKEAQKVVPLRSRISRMVSWAGSWAMRPQTAMAAVFLLMIGTTSVLLLRARQFDGGSMVVTEKGAPAAAAPAPEAEESFDTAHAAGAHGAFEVHKPVAAQAPPASASAPPNEDGVLKEGAKNEALATGEQSDRSRSDSPADLRRAYGQARGPVAIGDLSKADEDSLNAAGGAPPPPPAAMAAPADPQNAAAPAGAPPQQQMMPVAKGAPSTGGDSSFEAAMAQYRARNYAEATRGFDALAAAGNPNAALMAARSVRDSTGCGDALPRYNAIIARTHGTQVSYDAALEAGRCERSVGALDSARSRFASLLTVPSHAPRAQAELDEMNPRLATKRTAPAAKPSPGSKAPAAIEAAPPADTKK